MEPQVYSLIKGYWRRQKLGVPYFGVLILTILLFRVLYLGPIVSETPILLMDKTLHYPL